MGQRGGSGKLKPTSYRPIFASGPALNSFGSHHWWINLLLQNDWRKLRSTFERGSREPTFNFVGHLCTELQAYHCFKKELHAAQRTAFLDQIIQVYQFSISFLIALCPPAILCICARFKALIFSRIPADASCALSGSVAMGCLIFTKESSH